MNILIELRKKYGLSQKELADALHVNQSAVSKWELGERELKGQMLLAVAKYFNVSADFLLSYDAEENINQRNLDATDLGQLYNIYSSLNKEHKKAILEFAQFLADKEKQGL